MRCLFFISFLIVRAMRNSTSTRSWHTRLLWLNCMLSSGVLGVLRVVFGITLGLVCLAVLVQVEFESLAVVFKAEVLHGPEDVFAVDGLSLLVEASFAGF
jgi:hypothetical protein